MALKGKLGETILKITLDGWETAKKKMEQLGEGAKKIGENLQSIGNKAAVNFAVLTGSITGFLKAADPVRFEIFTQKLQILSMYVGQIFIPLLKEAIVIVNRLIAVFQNLSPHQQDQILKWTKIALAVLGLGTAMAVAVKGITSLMAVLKSLSVVIGILESETGIGLVLALVAAGFAIYELVKNSEQLTPLLDALQNAWDTLKEAVKPLGDLFGMIGEKLSGIASQIISKAVPIIQVLIHAFERLIPPIMRIADVFVYLYMVYVQSIQKAFDRLAGESGRLIPIIMKIGKFLEDTFTKFAEIMERSQPAIEKVIEAVVDLGATLVELYMEVISDLVDELVDLGKQLWDTFGDEIVNAIKVVADVIREVVREIKSAVETAKELYATYKKFREATLNGLDRLNPFTKGHREDRIAAENRQLEEQRRKDEHRDQKKADERKQAAKDANNRPKDSPLRAARVETFGLEEAFRKAQKAAEFDPAKLAAMEQRKLQQQGNDILGEIRDNVRKRPDAMNVN